MVAALYPRLVTRTARRYWQHAQPDNASCLLSVLAHTYKLSKSRFGLYTFDPVCTTFDHLPDQCIHCLSLLRQVCRVGIVAVMHQLKSGLKHSSSQQDAFSNVYSTMYVALSSQAMLAHRDFIKSCSALHAAMSNVTLQICTVEHAATGEPRCSGMGTI